MWYQCPVGSSAAHSLSEGPGCCLPGSALVPGWLRSERSAKQPTSAAFTELGPVSPSLNSLCQLLGTWVESVGFEEHGWTSLQSEDISSSQLLPVSSREDSLFQPCSLTSWGYFGTLGMGSKHLTFKAQESESSAIHMANSGHPSTQLRRFLSETFSDKVAHCLCWRMGLEASSVIRGSSGPSRQEWTSLYMFLDVAGHCLPSFSNGFI